MRLAAPLLTIAAAAALTACGEDREATTGTSTTGTETSGTETAAKPQGKPAQAVEIEESEFKLAPSRVKLDKPGVYEFRARNVGNTVHALEVEGQGTEVETKEIQPGRSASLKAELKDGEYKLYCPVGNHEQQGMVGSVTVGKGGGGAGTSTSEDEGSDDSGGGGGYGY